MYFGIKPFQTLHICRTGAQEMGKVSRNIASHFDFVLCSLSYSNLLLLLAGSSFSYHTDRLLILKIENVHTPDAI